MPNLLKVLIGLLLLNALSFADSQRFYSPETKEWFQKSRSSLLESLKNGDSSRVVSIIDSLREKSPDEYAIDNLEVMEAYFLVGRYDLAFPLWTVELEKRDNVVGYSFVSDSLLEYLDQNMNFADSRVLENVLQKAMYNAGSTELQDFAMILYELSPYFDVKNKYNATHVRTWEDGHVVYKPILENIQEESIFLIRVSDFHFYRPGVDMDNLKELAAKMDKFEQNYPQSSYISWVQKEHKLLLDVIGDIPRHFDYTVDRLYTGGVGFEAWYSASGVEFAVPLQRWRILIIPTYFMGSEDDENDFYVNLGFDAFELKRFKVVPFVGFGTAFVAGGQLEFRGWLESRPDPKFHVATYLSLKMKYEASYGERTVKTENVSVDGENSRKEKSFRHRFFVGLGLHLW
jgi:hypothetical protein